MTNVALYSNQPSLLTGFQSILASQEDLTLSLGCGSFEPFIDRIQSESHDVLLVELTPEITIASLGRLKRAAARAAMVLWADRISTELAMIVIGLGVRGTLRVVSTPRERRLVGLLAQGLKNQGLAYALGITEGSTNLYFSRLSGKVSHQDCLELAFFAIKNYAPTADCAASFGPGQTRAAQKVRPAPWIPSVLKMGGLRI
jgi:DNA-binding NarL/FixJ family response regulator